MPRVLFIENHDSFSWNVIEALPFERAELEVVSAAEAWHRLDQAEHVVMGPGPTDPVRAGLVELVHEIARRQLPFLGVCLGHQALGLAFGATLIRSVPAHGKQAIATFSGSKRFAGIEGDFEVMRYHSLSLTDVKSPLREVARLSDGTVMAIEHASLPMAGVQFHPDSFGTPRGREVLASFFGKASRTTNAVAFSSPTQERQAERQHVSSLREKTAFALLAPGYADHGCWTLLENLQEHENGELWFATAEGTPRRFTGTRRLIALEFDVAVQPLSVSLDDGGYLERVSAIREEIAAGDVYQVNLTLRAELRGADGAQLLASLCRKAVPRFAAWVKHPALGELVSASPELLVETGAAGDRVGIHVEPMKGTAPAGQRAWLERSEKDRAELAMITDLLRDDLHRLCEPGTVHVRNAQRMIELPYVVQAVADVDGVLRAGVTLAQVLEVVHPGGSVTGAPRPAALQTIAKLEPTLRGAYCGTLGLETGSTSRFALLIRTAERAGEAWRYGVGSGITWDSDPGAELEEVRLKLGALHAR